MSLRKARPLHNLFGSSRTFLFILRYEPCFEDPCSDSTELVEVKLRGMRSLSRFKFSARVPIISLKHKRTQKVLLMTQFQSPWDPLEILTSDLTGFYALFRSVIRFAVGKYGGTMTTDPATGATYVDIPTWAEDLCLEELAQLVGPGKPLNSFLPFLVD